MEKHILLFLEEQFNALQNVDTTESVEIYNQILGKAELLRDLISFMENLMKNNTQ